MRRIKDYMSIINERIKDLPPELKMENIKKEVKVETKPKKPGLWFSNFEDEPAKEPLKTGYKFLKEVSGLSEGSFNVVAGRTGKGKTDLLISLAADNLLNGYSIGFCLSEGKLSEYSSQLKYVLLERTKCSKTVEKLLDQVMGFTASSINVNSSYDYSYWVNSFYNKARFHKLSIIYLDNLSTISFTNSTPEVESGFTEALVRGASDNNVCVVAAIHPIKSLNPNVEITKDQFRGNASHVNMATNVFALNNFDNINSGLRIIKTLKSRYFGEKEGKCFELKFKKLKFRGFYRNDSPINQIQAKRYFSDNYRRNPSGRN